MSHAPGLRGIPDSGHCSSAATSASCARSSASPTSRTMRARPAMRRGDSMRQTASIARLVSVTVSPIITFRSRVIRRGHMKRKGSAVWQGGLKDGKGTVSTDSGVLSNTQYSFSTRFEDGKGTNPEELIAAAHASCFSMALSGQLGNAGMTAESIATTATVNLEKTDAGFTITAVHLDVTAKIPGADDAKFQ